MFMIIMGVVGKGKGGIRVKTRRKSLPHFGEDKTFF